MQGEKEKEEITAAIGNGINEFIQKRRKPIFITAAFILLSLIVFIAVLSITGIMRAGIINSIENLNSRYETLLPSITEEYTAIDVDELLADLEAFVNKPSVKATSYAAAKAWSLIANIHVKKKDWPAAEAAWISSARAANKIYIAPLAFFNAAAAAEEQGKTQEAIEYYTLCLASSSDFSAAPRSQFAIGRLQESLGNNAAAIEAYRSVISGWPYDQIWPSLARSRIIALEE